MANFGTVALPVSFAPQTAFPLDSRYYFDSLESAQSVAASAVEVGSSDGTYFIGQNVVVVTSSDAKLYVIQPDKTLKEVGSSVLTDNKTITTTDGTLSLKDFGTQYYPYIPGEEGESGSWASSPTPGFKAGLEPKVRMTGDSQYELAWYEPATDTISGLQSAVASLQETVGTIESNVSSIEQRVQNLEDNCPEWETISE